MTAPDDGGRRGTPSGAKLAVTFGLGVLVGFALLLPAAGGDVGFSFGETGAVGDTLLLGVLVIATVTVGTALLFQLFLLTDR